MRLTLDCPQAEYRENMVIWCKRTGEPCAHQYYRKCKGWYVLSDGSKDCPARKEPKNG